MNPRIFFIIFLIIAAVIFVLFQNQPNKNQPNNTNPILTNTILEKFFPGVPQNVRTIPNFINDNQNTCVQAKGVINISKNGSLQCNKYIEGNELWKVTFNHPLNNFVLYLNTIYEAYTPKFNTSFEKFYKNLEILYENEFKRIIPVSTPKFYNIEYIEVIPLNIVFGKLDINTWKGTWYIQGTGTGWFIKNDTTFFCYNILHGLNLFDISDETVNNAAQTTILNRNDANNPNFKIKIINDSLQMLLTQVAVQRGYKNIQISNEWDGNKYERYFVDLKEPIYSVVNCVRKNPFDIKKSKNDENLWLDLFLNKNIPQIDSKYILDIVPPKSLSKRYGDFAFKTNCAKNFGTISIGDMLLNCEAIVKFGMPSKRLDSEISKIDYSKFPQSNELEKLQSYFTIVYGFEEEWKKRSLETLQDYWKRMEMRYKLQIFPDTPYNIYKPLNFGIDAPGIIAYQENGRLAEAVKYVEVVRQNLRNAFYDSGKLFIGCYYYPCRGSGLFIPIGKLFIAKTKQLAAKAFEQNIALGGNAEDQDIAKIAIYKGYDTIMFVRYSGFTRPESVELLDLRDPITSQMNLIRTHPWDPAIQEKVPYLVQDAYGINSGIDISQCISNFQYEPGTGKALCLVSF